MGGKGGNLKRTSSRAFSVASFGNHEISMMLTSSDPDIFGTEFNPLSTKNSS